MGGLDTAGLDIDPGDVMNGGFLFEVDPDGEGFVINLGMIEVATGGKAVLLGKSMSNERMILVNGILTNDANAAQPA